jgi:hypothetical protein
MPLFKHKRLIAVAMLGILAALSAGALYVRPLSGDLATATRSGRAERIAADGPMTTRQAAMPAGLDVILPRLN